MAIRIQPTDFVKVYSEQFAEGKLNYEIMRQAYFEGIDKDIALVNDYPSEPYNLPSKKQLYAIIAVDKQVLKTFIEAQEHYLNSTLLGKIEDTFSSILKYTKTEDCSTRSSLEKDKERLSRLNKNETVQLAEFLHAKSSGDYTEEVQESLAKHIANSRKEKFILKSSDKIKIIQPGKAVGTRILRIYSETSHDEQKVHIQDTNGLEQAFKPKNGNELNVVLGIHLKANANEQRIEKTYQPNGETHTRYANGDVHIQPLTGKGRLIKQNGDVHVRNSDGIEQVFKPNKDGNVFIPNIDEYSDYIRNSDGTEKFIRKNGDIYIQHTDGMYELRKNNGDTYIKLTNGTYKVFQHNGDIYIVNSDHTTGKVIPFKGKECELGEHECKSIISQMS